MLLYCRVFKFQVFLNVISSVKVKIAAKIHSTMHLAFVTSCFKVDISLISSFLLMGGNLKFFVNDGGSD